MVMATPLLCSLRQSEEGELWAVGKASAIHLYNGLNLFDRFIPYDGRSGVGFLDTVSNVKELSFERGIVLPHSFRSALLFFLGAVRTRIGYARNGRGFMLTEKVGEAAVAPEPTVEHYLRILDALGVSRTMESPKLGITDDEERRFDERFIDVGGDYGVFIVGAEYGPSKRWPESYFSQLADMIVENLPVRIYLLPGKGEEAIAMQVVEGAKHKDRIELKAMGMRELKVCLARAAFVVSNDTGPRHIAAALSVPTLTLLGPMDDRYTSYRSDSTYCLSADVACRPCNKRKCGADHECMKDIAPEEVFRKIQEVVRERPA
jgi:heptosyltransferase-2